jgi:hypothetical protein
LANAFAPLRVSTPAATVFDLIRYAPRLGGFERAMETLAPLIPLIRVPDLKAVLKSEGEVAMAQRMGYVFDIAGKAELADVVERWLPPHLDLIPLSKSSPKTKVCQVVRRWRILNNAPELAL